MDPFVYLVFWFLVCPILGALAGPRNGWTPGGGALIGVIFGLFGVLFLLIKSAPRPSPESDRLADELEEYEAWQQGRGPVAAPPPYVPCPECESRVPVNAGRCPKCQTKLSNCEDCGGLIPLDEMVCRYCGAEYDDDEVEDPDGRPADT